MADDSERASVGTGEFQPSDWPRFIQSAVFSRGWANARLGDDDLRALESVLLDDAKAGRVVKGTGGLRKLWFVPPGSAGGKSGGYRVCYVDFETHGIIFLVILYAKNRKADLSPAEARAIARLIDETRDDLDRSDKP